MNILDIVVNNFHCFFLTQRSWASKRSLPVEYVTMTQLWRSASTAMTSTFKMTSTTNSELYFTNFLWKYALPFLYEQQLNVFLSITVLSNSSSELCNLLIIFLTIMHICRKFEQKQISVHFLTWSIFSQQQQQY